MPPLLRIIKTTLGLCLGVAVAVVVAGAIYLNQVGFPGAYGEWLKQELAKRQLYLEFDSLHLSLKQGLIAHEVNIYQSPSDPRPTFTARELILDIDKSLALRGRLALREIFLRKGTSHFIAAENIEAIQAENIESKIYLDPGNHLRVRETSATVQGLDLKLRCDLSIPTHEGDAGGGDAGGPPIETILRPILEELARWKIPTDSPPQLNIEVSGDLADQSKIETRFSLSAQNLTRNDYFLKSLEISGDVRNDLLTFDHILLIDKTGRASGQADWRGSTKEGRFHLSSSLQFQDFLQSCFGLKIAPQLKINSSPQVLVDGRMTQKDDGHFSIKASGQAHMGHFSFIGTNYTSLSSAFSWQDGDLYLQNLEVGHARGRLTGSFLAEGSEIRYRIRSNLPMEAFAPFLPNTGPTARTIADFQLTPKSQIALTLKGTVNRKNLKRWDTTGNANVTEFSYRGVRVKNIATQVSIKPGLSQFSKISLLIDDSTENARTRFKGPPSERLEVDAILYQSDLRKLIITNLRGKAWPTPILRAFAPKTAQNIEENYRFHEPPDLTLNGSFDCRHYRDNNNGEHNAYQVSVRTTGRTDYPFLKRLLPLTNLTANVWVRGNELKVTDLSFKTMQGRASGEVGVSFVPGEKSPPYRGNIKWRDISFKDISRIYQFDEEEKGTLTGHFDFIGKGGSVRGLSGRGFLSLQKGNIVSLPVFGPLSPLLAGILGDKRMGYERAKDASASFVVRDGIWKTEDFLAVSSSLNLTGIGWVDLAKDQIDMTVRLNARGLLGIITLPLAPIKGLFQFRGTGQFTDSKWNSSPFTQPKLGKRDPLFRPAGKAIVVEDKE